MKDDKYKRYGIVLLVLIFAALVYPQYTSSMEQGCNLPTRSTAFGAIIETRWSYSNGCEYLLDGGPYSSPKWFQEDTVKRIAR